jgi:LuxR family maltose regulon positive regulatory protein
MARIELERYNLDAAEAYLEKGLRIARPGGFTEAERVGRYIRAHLDAARGQLEAAMEGFLATARIVNAMDDAYLTGELHCQWASLSLKAGDLDTAREKLQVVDEVIATTQHANLRLWRWGLTPRLLCAEERFLAAGAALDEAICQARAVNCNGELIRLLALQALTLKALGDQTPVRAALREALALGAPEGYIWRWLDAGPGLTPLLRDLRDDPNISQASGIYLDSLLDTFQTVFGEPQQPKRAGLPEPLTPRELEIMYLICEGYSNPEIAGVLVVTLNTIKKHTSNIYAKLGVSSRTQAIARVHELGLI